VVTLGPSAAVDVGALSALFRDTTTSYKYVFFLGLLRCLDRRDEPSPRVPLREAIVEVLALAWYPHTFFRLSLGAQDQIGATLDDLSTRMGRQELGFSSTDVERLRASIDLALSPAQHRKLARYVPYRLLAPFFQAELGRVSETRKQDAIATLSRAEFATRKPLYHVDGDQLVLHPDWVVYLRENRSVVQGWASWHWLEYMQARNPNVPNLAGKLFPVVSRSPLTRQLAYWNAAAQAEALRCIYSGERLTRSGELLTHVELDHYVPWSFVLHDRIWNLVPVTPRANSSKGDRLADSRYLDRLIDLQCQALIASRQHLARRAWERFAEEFEQDLRVPSAVIRAHPPDREALRRSLADAYRETIPALENLATRQGFPSGWTYLAQRDPQG
jgi:5-methylcytosine-specific restriction endonuclease McrA